MKLDYNKCLINVKAFLPDDKEIIKIIKLCYLEPVKNNWRIWSDNQGNIITLFKNRVVISRKINNYLLKADDLYLKSPAESIIENSRWAMICLEEDNCVIWLLGVDSRLRHIHYTNGVWIGNVPPMNNGINSIRTVIENLDTDKVITYPNKKSWAANLPLKPDITKDIFSTNKDIGEAIKEITK